MVTERRCRHFRSGELIVAARTSPPLSGKNSEHMSFRKTNNQTDQWRAFCTKHDRYVSQLPRLATVFATADRFDQFLQSGIHDRNDAMLTIMSLTEPQRDGQMTAFEPGLCPRQ